MIKTTGKIFSNSHSVHTLIFRNWSPIVSYTNKGNFNSRRCAHSTIDSNDLFQGNPNILKTFWDREGVFRGLHAFNHVRLPYFRDCIIGQVSGDKFSTCLEGKKILDVGCGAGLVSEGLAKYGAEVIGLDSSEQLIDMAQEHSSKNKRLANNKPTYVLSTIEEHSEKFPDTYDAVIASEVIEHVTEKELFVECCARVTKPGGKIIYTTPNKTLFARFYIIFMFENILRCYPKNAHQFDKFMTPNELKFMLEMNNCHVESVKGYFYYPWDNSWSWTNSQIFSFAMQAVKAK